MFNLLRAGALALVLALSCAPAMAESQAGKPISGGTLGQPIGVAIYCDDGTGVAVICSLGGGGGGGGGGGDASAANQTSQITLATAIRNQIGALTSPATGSTNYWLADLDAVLRAPITVATHAVSQSGTWNVSLTGTLPAFATTPTFNIGAGGLGTIANPVITAPASAAASSIGTIGSAAPATASQIAGRDQAGNLKATALGSNGGLLPTQAAPTTTRTTLTASTATLISAATAARLFFTVQLETSPSANVYLCFTQATGCSPTNYDVLVASGAALGTIYSAPFGFTGAAYAYSTATPALTAGSWAAQ